MLNNGCIIAYLGDLTRKGEVELPLSISPPDLKSARGVAGGV